MSNGLDDRRKGLEEEYFRRREKEALEKLRAQAMAETETKNAVATLRCPKCDGTLREIAFEDVQIDRCDRCNGVWLDAGELERLTKHESGGWLSRMWQSFASE